jgi:hypothetical protein
MDVPGFQTLFPQFPSPTYDARIAVLLAAAPEYDPDKLGTQLDLATGLWVADQLAAQDIAIKFGAGGVLASSSSSTEKRVGSESIKTSISQGAKAVAGQTTYGARLDALLSLYGMGAVATLGPVFCGQGPF